MNKYLESRNIQTIERKFKLDVELFCLMASKFKFGNFNMVTDEWNTQKVIPVFF